MTVAIEYRLTIAGTTPIEEVAGRAFPDPAERPNGTLKLLVADLHHEYGFNVTIRAGRNGYIWAESEEGPWEWEPAEYASMTFRMEKNAVPERSVVPMLTTVRRVLESGREDVSLDLNGSWLILTRTDGVIGKHMRVPWWDVYPSAGPIIPDGESSASGDADLEGRPETDGERTSGP